MLNSFLSQLLFGTSTANTSNNDTDIATNNNANIINEKQSSTNVVNLASAITNNDEKYLHVRSDVDWVIIDPADQDEVKKHLKRKSNAKTMAKSMNASEYGLSVLFEQNTTAPIAINNRLNLTGGSDGNQECGSSSSAMDRSLSVDSRCATPVETNMQPEEEDEEEEEEQHENETKQQQVQQQQQQQETWLLTPLPTLVSLNSSQRSFIENAPLENLLIEHPSMSVFIQETSLSSLDETTTTTPADVINEANNNKDETTTKQVASTATVKKSKKKNKKNKQQNKENIAKSSNTTTTATAAGTKTTTTAKQPARLLLCKQTTNSPSSSSSLTSPSSHKQTQVKRMNKLQETCKNYIKNVNLKQRKYHNLQQPFCNLVVNVRNH